MSSTPTFVADCSLCPRLAGQRAALDAKYPDYHNGPVDAFGDPAPKLLIVGLAPGLHGANATGRPFTGDYAGILLYQTLFDTGFATATQSKAANDGLMLKDARITNAVKCWPPENKPTTAEANTCRSFLRAEIQSLQSVRVILASGTIAHRAVVLSVDGKLSDFRFAHGAEHQLPNDRSLIDSYHCSRYNTQTRRLTDQMFRQVLARARSLALA